MNKKHLAALILPLLALSAGAAHAKTECCSQAVVAELCECIEITCCGGQTHTSIACCDGHLTQALTPKFKVETNKGQKVYLQATVADTVGNKDAFFNAGSTNYIALGNTATGYKPTPAAVIDCESASPTAANNGNIIGYSLVSLNVSNSGSQSYDSAKHQFDIDVNPGVTDVSLSTGTSAKASTYSMANDVAGNYEAIVTLTTASL